MKKQFFIASLILVLLFSGAGVFAQGADEAASKSYEVRFPTGESEGDFMTVWARNFGEYMAEETDGRWTVNVFPYGTLGENDDIVELAQNGVVEFVFADYGWLSAYIPQTNVLALHYVWPREGLIDILDWVNNNGAFMGQLEEKYREKGLIPLGVFFEGWQWLTTKNTPINSVDDLVGLKTRIMGSAMLAKDYAAYGIDPTPLPYGEIYSGLQTGLIDAQSQPMFANYSMAFYEVADHFVQLWAEPFIGIPAVNADVFDSLSAEDQKLIRDYWKSVVKESGEQFAQKNVDFKNTIAEKRPEISFKELSDEQVAQLKDMAMTKVWPTFSEIAGDDSEMLLEVLQKDIADAQAALGL